MSKAIGMSSFTSIFQRTLLLPQLLNVFISPFITPCPLTGAARMPSGTVKLKGYGFPESLNLQKVLLYGSRCARYGTCSQSFPPKTSRQCRALSLRHLSALWRYPQWIPLDKKNSCLAAGPCCQSQSRKMTCERNMPQDI